MHLIALHDTAGSGNPLGVSGNYDRLPFAPYFIFKDLITIFLFIVVLSVFVFFMPNLLGDSENYVMANPMQTPPAIVPEWYLLPFYAILRSIPNKLLGVIAMFSAILILLVMPFTDLGRSRGLQFRPLSKLAFYIFIANFLILMQLGAKHVESPFIEFGQVSTVLYFSHFLIIVPLVSLLENSLVELHTDKKSVTRYPWLSYQFYLYLLQGLLNRAYSSLESCLSSPPKPFSYATTPVKSAISFKTLFISLLVVLLVSFSIKYPLILMLKLLGLLYFLPLISGICAVLVSMIKKGLYGKKATGLKCEWITFFTSILLGTVIFIINLYYMDIVLLLGEKIGVIATLLSGLLFIIQYFYEVYFLGLDLACIRVGSIFRGIICHMNTSEHVDISRDDLTYGIRHMSPTDIELIYRRTSEYQFYLYHKFRNMKDSNMRLNKINTNLTNYPGDLAYFRAARAQQRILWELITQVEQKFAERATLVRAINAKYSTTFSNNHPFNQKERDIYEEAKNHINKRYE